MFLILFATLRLEKSKSCPASTVNICYVTLTYMQFSRCKKLNLFYVYVMSLLHQKLLQCRAQIRIIWMSKIILINKRGGKCQCDIFLILSVWYLWTSSCFGLMRQKEATWTFAQVVSGSLCVCMLASCCGSLGDFNTTSPLLMLEVTPGSQGQIHGMKKKSSWIVAAQLNCFKYLP